MTSLLWLAPTRSLPGTCIPQVCNTTPVLLLQTQLTVVTPPAPTLPAAPYLSPMVANDEKPEPEYKLPPPLRFLIWCQEKKLIRKTVPKGGHRISTCLYLWPHTWTRKDVGLIETLRILSPATRTLYQQGACGLNGVLSLTICTPAPLSYTTPLLFPCGTAKLNLW